MLDTGSYTLELAYQLGDELDVSTLQVPFSAFTTPFSGKFDGRSHSIRALPSGLFSGLTATAVVSDLNLSSAADAALNGLVAQSNAGTIQRVRASGVVVSPDSHAGLLVGDNVGVIEDCWSSGSIQAQGAHIGGLVGRNDGTIRRSFSTATVSGNKRVGGLVGTQSSGLLELSYAVGPVTAPQNPGGLVGSFFAGSIRNCYARSPLVSGPQAGGLVGNYESNTSAPVLILNSYSTSTVTGTDAQGLLGSPLTSTAVTVTNSYYLDTAVGSVGTPLTSAQLKTQSSYVGWAFGSIWKLDTRISPYPSLVYESP